MIAEVIVDVAAYPIDRPFDYIVPETMESIIETGSRVKVPFGPRKVIGYVTKLKEESELEVTKLKPIDELSRSMSQYYLVNYLELSSWLAVQTLSYEIDAMQVMLPAAMRARYEKYILVDEPENIEDEDFKRFLVGRKRVPMKEAESFGFFEI